MDSRRNHRQEPSHATNRPRFHICKHSTRRNYDIQKGEIINKLEKNYKDKSKEIKRVQRFIQKVTQNNKNMKDINSTPISHEDLLNIQKHLKIISTDIAIQNLEKLATTDERKAIWFLCSGKFTREDLAKQAGAHINTVKNFVDIAMTYGLLEEEKGKGGHPKRVIDYAPSEWKFFIKELKTSKKLEDENQPKET
jgi:hypothetical protein